MRQLVLSIVAVSVVGSVAASPSVAVDRPLHSATSSAGCVAPRSFSRAPHRPYSVSDAAVYREACTLARLFGPKQLAREYRIRSSNPAVICERWAGIGYQPVLFRPAFAGCRKGFALR